ncbi:NADP-dependent mannitol dehydrogenase [Leucosporidium creatinivorum]|uniref:NADP-dependent mannitol dehydrogenase n=1 Tax=Leucosporidium creatinivorum TaxID=106004 RepID=A0A1Y2EZE8_9BASI|nr:NADP-dependent mannitol dehydrogenase [Leucosporidium creatinivorum]
MATATSVAPIPTDPQASGNKGWAIDFSGKTVVVTGGNRGLGRGLTEALAQAGASVAIIYNSAKDAEDVAAELSKKWDAKIKAYQCNVAGNMDHITKTFAQIESDLGPIHGLVANSGISVVKPALELTSEDFNKVFGVNVLGVFQTCQAAAALWIKRNQPGSIVIVSSMSSQIVNSPLTQCFYNSSKGAVSNLGRCLAAEWAPNQIRVNMLSPGFIKTAQTSGMPADLRAAQASQVPLGRFSEPFEQAAQVLLFLSPYSSYQTGSEAFVDGGFLIW